MVTTDHIHTHFMKYEGLERSNAPVLIFEIVSYTIQSTSLLSIYMNKKHMYTKFKYIDVSTS